ncbi:MAG: ABC transporter substrate-binding protein [Bacteroidales bacterium]
MGNYIDDFNKILEKIGIFLLLALSSTLSLFCQNNQNKPLNLGLLIQDYSSTDARNGAELAVSLINEAGGINGRPLNLIVKSMEGPWGTGSNQAVSLIFDEEVFAIIGSADGRNCHLIEQACTKTQVPFVSCLSSDPTLAQAFIPWFFNCVPNDIQQSEVLVHDILIRNRYKKIALVSGNDYDSRSILKFFKRKFEESVQENQAELKIFEFTESNVPEVLKKVNASRPDCIVLFSRSKPGAAFLKEMKRMNLLMPVYGNLYLVGENSKHMEEIQKTGIKLKISFIDISGEKYKWFTEIYSKKYDVSPGISAGLAFDAVSILANAVSNAGTDRESIQNYLLKKNFEGITGNVVFDKHGNRMGPFNIIEF